MARTGTTPAPALPRYVVAVTSAAAAGLALIAATTCAAVLVSAPVSLVARLTTMSLPVTATLSGELFAPGFLNSAVTSSPPRWPHSLAVSTTAAACACRGGAGDRLDLEREVAEVALEAQDLVV